MARPKASIIISSYGDGDQALDRVAELSRANKNLEFIIVEGREPLPKSDNAIVVAAEVTGRAHQMNQGAKLSSGDVLFFLHADTKVGIEGIAEALRRCVRDDDDMNSGVFKLKLDSEKLVARLVEFGVALRELLFGLSYGDQCIFVRRDVFEDIGGFEKVPILEDVLIVRELRKRGGFAHLNHNALTSSRRYEENGYFKTSFMHMIIILRWFFGAAPEDLAKVR